MQVAIAPHLQMCCVFVIRFRVAVFAYCGLNHLDKQL